jgi:aryl-alcohol dehydrogenase-like predicted oxidoreductase
VTSVVIGAETEEQLRRNVSLAVRPPLSADERAAVVAALPDVPDALLDPSRWTA